MKIKTMSSVADVGTSNRKPAALLDASQFINHRYMVNLNDISIRTDLKPGDLGNVVFLHGLLYSREYGYGLDFESFVAAGLHEFHSNYDPAKDRVWICEYKRRMIGFLLLMHRENNVAQLRYFLLEPEYRDLGLGKKLMQLYMDFFHQCGYKSLYLWTTHELDAAAILYKRYGFKLTEEKTSTVFGKPLKEQRYDLIIKEQIEFSD
ncbi:MAG TPA: GNAT family N-acetyltransferase [candidate division Zixibacteria bacterium]|nr:GNAT family N-acetyltransferase [candidate division Zixibacteria bacterium]